MDKKFNQVEGVFAGRRLSRRYLGAALVAGILSLTLSGCGVEDAVNASTPTFTLTTIASPPEGGTVSRNPEQTAYYGNSDVLVTATPNEGYTFTGWTGALTSTSPTITAKISGNTTLTANFKKTDDGGVTPPPGGGGTSYTLNVSASPTAGGKISLDPDRTSYNADMEVKATATPNAGYEFVGWSGASTSFNATITVIMNKDISLTANFQKTDGGGAPTFYALTVAAVPAAGGSVTRSPDKESYSVGEHVTATAEPKDGYKFTGWSGASESTEQTVTITMNADKALIAAFEKISGGDTPTPTPTYPLTVVASPANGGTVSRNPDKDAYDAGTQVVVTATAAVGYVFTGWAEASSAKASPVTITMDRSKVLIANFEKQNDVPVSYILTVNAVPAAGGSVSRNPSTTSYNAGATVSVTAAPASGYTFTGWSGASTSANATITVTMDGNKTLTANFTQTQTPPTPTYTLTVSASPANGGTVLRNPTKTTFNAGESVTLTAAPSSGYKFTGWSGASTSTNAAITITMDGNKTLTATFTESTAGWRMLNDFADGRTENYFGTNYADRLASWWVWSYGGLPEDVITSEPLSFDDYYSAFNAPMNAISGGRSGNNDYSAGIVYQKVLDIPPNTYPGVGFGTSILPGTLTDVDTISFWAKGTTPGVNLTFEVRIDDDDDNKYQTSLTGVTESWKQYKISISPVRSVSCPSSTATGSTSSRAGDLSQGNWVSKCYEFKPERIDQLGWNISLGGGYSGSLYIDDIQLHYTK